MFSLLEQLPISVLFHFDGSILGGALLVASLYSVLWAKSREAIKPESEEQPGNKEHKEAAAVEAATAAPFAFEQV